ncbi:MAG: DNA-3-methyladenine glycosylase I [Candidatus Heimdallarchaeota archaeon]|nr:DNA-3-methyladenine glycosylase I [Candidatus Heimdallarchaeota archaeon]
MEHNPMTNWFIRDKKPPTDDAIFENLTRVIFQGGLNWKIIDNKWPNFQKAFVDFSIDDVANFTEDDVVRLMEDASIVRNAQKIESTIYNAKEFLKIKEEFGSFPDYLKTLDKSNNYESVVKILSKRFKRLGPKSCHIFLYSIGEDIKHDKEVLQ